MESRRCVVSRDHDVDRNTSLACTVRRAVDCMSPHAEPRCLDFACVAFLHLLLFLFLFFSRSVCVLFPLFISLYFHFSFLFVSLSCRNAASPSGSSVPIGSRPRKVNRKSPLAERVLMRPSTHSSLKDTHAGRAHARVMLGGDAQVRSWEMRSNMDGWHGKFAVVASVSWEGGGVGAGMELAGGSFRFDRL